MIHFVVTAAHAYTFSALKEGYGPRLPETTTLSYSELFAAERVAAGCYVFCDIERLSDAELILASHLYRDLKASGKCRVFNDPARVRIRYGLLRALREGGVNDFDGYRADGFPKPRRFPVFIRRQSDHDRPLSDLLSDQNALDRRLAELEQSGEALRGLVVIEYCAEPFAPGIFRRYGAFRIGETIHLDHVATEDSWNVKYGKKGLVDDSVYRDDDLAIRENRFEPQLRRAFDLAGIDYGRADFGLVGGRPQIYEINTNPYIGALAPHPSEIRSGSNRFSHERLAALLWLIDMPSSYVTVRIGSAKLAAHRRARKRLVEYPGTMRVEIATLRAALEKARAEVAAIRASTSWKITAPLRRTVAAVRGRKTPPKT